MQFPRCIYLMWKIHNHVNEGRFISLKVNTFQTMINVPIDNANTWRRVKCLNGHRCCRKSASIYSHGKWILPIIRKNFDCVSAHKKKMVDSSTNTDVFKDNTEHVTPSTSVSTNLHSSNKDVGSMENLKL